MQTRPSRSKMFIDRSRLLKAEVSPEDAKKCLIVMRDGYISSEEADEIQKECNVSVKLKDGYYYFYK